MPRDREARFDPQLIAKYQRRFRGFDDKVISMYARGMSTREMDPSMLAIVTAHPLTATAKSAHHKAWKPA